MTLSRVLLLKSSLLAHWQAGQVSDASMEREFRALDDVQPGAWADTWPRFLVGVVLVGAAVSAWAWALR